MPGTSFASDNALTIQKWSAWLYKQALQDIFFGKFVGKDDRSLIQTKTDLTKDKGDKIAFALRMNLTGAGVTGDGAIEGNEEALVFHDFLATLDLRGHGVKAAGKMSMRRTAFDIKSEAKDALADWMAEKVIDKDTVYALSGLANPAGTVAKSAPSTNRRFYGGQTTGGVITSVASDALCNSTTNHLFGSALISMLKRKAKKAYPKIRPIMVNGKAYFVCFIDPLQNKALKNEDAYQQAQREAGVRGKENVIFSGADSIWDGVVIHEYDQLENRTGDGVGTAAGTYFEEGDPCANGVTVARALFCGAQAGVHAYGQYPGWYEENFDYKRVPGVATDVILAVAKTKFNGEDFGLITVDTAVVED